MARPTTPPTSPKKRRRRRVVLASLGFMLLPVAAFAYDALDVTVPVLPAVGESQAGACDIDGVTTSYAYGATAANGVRVNGVTVTGIEAACSNGTVAFMNGTTTVATYSGNVASGVLTLATAVWTNDFTSVRVALYP